MTIRELEREVIAAAVEWHVAGAHMNSDKDEERFEASLERLDEAARRYLRAILERALAAPDSPSEATREQTVSITRRETIRQAPAELERKVEAALATPAAKRLPAVEIAKDRGRSGKSATDHKASAKTVRSEGGAFVLSEKKCVKCGKTYHPRGNRQVKCEACGGGKSQKKPPAAGATSPLSSTSPGKSAIAAPPRKKAEAKAPASYALKPKRLASEDPKKAEFVQWMHDENEKRAAAGKAIADRALAGVGADVEDVPLAKAVEKHA